MIKLLKDRTSLIERAGNTNKEGSAKHTKSQASGRWGWGAPLPLIEPCGSTKVQA